MGHQFMALPGYLYSLSYINNFADLYTFTVRFIKHWDCPHLSWFERINLVQPVLLLKFIFLFWSLFIPLSQSYIKKCQKVLDNFVWLNKRHRISFKTSTKLKEAGGLGYANLKLYWKASQLTNLLKMFDTNLDEYCVLIEHSFFA